MSKRVRGGMILATMALVAGGGYYFFKIYRPKHALDGSRAEIEAWEERFVAARACLLGRTPGPGKTSEALAIREMSPDPWDRKSCAPLLGKLSRGDAPDPGSLAIDQGWEALDKAASRSALVYAAYAADPTSLAGGALPGALDALDDARRALRTAASMTIGEDPKTSLPAAKVIPIADGTDAVKLLEPAALPSAHGIVLFGETYSHLVQVRLTTGGAPEVARVGPQTIRSTPDMSWGVTIGFGGASSGAVNAEGVIPNGTIGNAFPKLRRVHAVSGTLDAGSAILEGEDTLAVLTTTHGVATTTQRKAAAVFVATDADGRLAVAWQTAAGAFGRVLGPDAGTSESEIPVAMPPMCLTRDRAWMRDGDHAVAFGGGRPTATHDLPPTEAPGAHDVRACTPDAALFGRVPSITVCSDECRPATQPPGAPEGASITVVDGKVVALATRGKVLGVWRTDATPVFYALPEPLTLRDEVMTDGNVIDVLAADGDAISLIRVPAH